MDFLLNLFNNFQNSDTSAIKDSAQQIFNNQKDAATSMSDFSKELKKSKDFMATEGKETSAKTEKREPIIKEKVSTAIKQVQNKHANKKIGTEDTEDAENIVEAKEKDDDEEMFSILPVIIEPIKEFTTQITKEIIIINDEEAILDKAAQIDTLNNLVNQIEEFIDLPGQEIVDIDFDKIQLKNLQLSNQERLEIQAALTDFIDENITGQQSNLKINPDSNTKILPSEIINSSPIDTIVEKIKNNDITNAEMKLDKNISNMKEIIEAQKVVISEYTETNTTDSEVKYSLVDEFDNININKLDLKSLKVDGKEESLNDTTELESLNIEELANESNTEADADANSDSGEQLFNNQFATNNTVKFSKITQTLTEKVEIKQLPKLITNEASDLKPNQSKEIKLVLNPENFGKVELNIQKTGNEVSIKVLVSNDSALKTLSNDLKELAQTFEAKGLELKELDVSKSDNNFNSQASKDQSTNHNDAKEEQAKRNSQRANTWAKNADSVEKLSFKDALNGITDLSK